MLLWPWLLLLITLYLVVVHECSIEAPEGYHLVCVVILVVVVVVVKMVVVALLIVTDHIRERASII